MWLAKEYGAAGLSRGEIASRLGVAPYFVGEYVESAARLSPEKLASLHHLLSELDVGVKTGRVPASWRSPSSRRKPRLKTIIYSARIMGGS